VADGAPCATSDQCVMDHRCRGNVCVASLAAGAPCDPAGDVAECSYVVGLYCDPVSRTCGVMPIRATGQTCPTDYRGGWCVAGGVCAMVSTETVATCHLAKQWEACGATVPCDVGATCHAGICTPISGVTCP
jgi:hypothetical protein